MKSRVFSWAALVLLLGSEAILAEDPTLRQEIPDQSEIWNEKLNSIKNGANLDDILRLLPPKSAISTVMCKYNRVLATDLRQLKVWAVDENYAVIVTIKTKPPKIGENADLNKTVSLGVPLLVFYRKSVKHPNSVDLDYLGIPR
jgi:hypothetical protein